MKIKALLISTLIAGLGLSCQAYAKQKSLLGEYTITKGEVETFSLPSNSLESSEQLGTFSITLKKTNWKELTGKEKSRTKKKVKIEGTLRGVISNQSFTASHTLVGEDRDFLLQSANDQMIITAGDPMCYMGEPMQITETVNLVAAAGKYQNMRGGTIVLEGLINNCPGQPNFGKNDLKIIPGESLVTFN